MLAWRSDRLDTCITERLLSWPTGYALATSFAAEEGSALLSQRTESATRGIVLSSEHPATFLAALLFGLDLLAVYAPHGRHLGQIYCVVFCLVVAKLTNVEISANRTLELTASYKVLAPDRVAHFEARANDFH